MQPVARYQRLATARDLSFFCDPSLWPQHPFLPVVRRPVGQQEPECGVLYDARGASGRYGYSATVCLTNLFLLPPTEAEFLASPRCAYDTPEELAADGWTVD
jgi:hypothetical protein